MTAGCGWYTSVEKGRLAYTGTNDVVTWVGEQSVPYCRGVECSTTHHPTTQPLPPPNLRHQHQHPLPSLPPQTTTSTISHLNSPSHTRVAYISYRHFAPTSRHASSRNPPPPHSTAQSSATGGAGQGKNVQAPKKTREPKVRNETMQIPHLPRPMKSHRYLW